MPEWSSGAADEAADDPGWTPAQRRFLAGVYQGFYRLIRRYVPPERLPDFQREVEAWKRQFFQELN